MLSIGLQIGHGHVKVATSDGRVATFPAVAAPAPAVEFAGLSARQIVSLDGTGWRNSNWLVGRDALDVAPGRLVSILDRTRYRSPSFVALARHALAQVAPRDAGPLAIMTGCPAAWFSDKTARNDLQMAIEDAAAPWREGAVTVAPEAAGVFYRYVFESGLLDMGRLRGAVGVIDCGFRDFNLGWFGDGGYVTGESVPGGLAEGLKEVKRLISATHGIELPLHEVDQAVRDGLVLVDGQERQLPAGTSAALAGGLDTVIAAARSIYPNGGRGLKTLLLAGGGAVVLGQALRQVFPQSLVMSEPQLAGARGFASAAAAQAARRTA
jgi:plasmid segregation protein ParM